MTEGRLAGKTAIVTGSGQNIGKAIAKLFAAEGAKVVINGSSSRDKVDAVVDEIHAAGGEAMPIMADVGDSEQVKALVDETVAAWGAVDIAVSNVSRRLRMPFKDITPEKWRETLNTNLNSCFYMAHHVLPGMSDRGWGRIIHISGYDGFTGHIPERAANVTAKAGMHALAKAIAREYGVNSITANTVTPGAIETERDMTQYSHLQIENAIQQIAVKKFGDVEDIAEACLYLAGDSGKFVTGQSIHVNGGQYMF